MRIAQIVVGFFESTRFRDPKSAAAEKIEGLIKANKTADINILLHVFLSR